VVPRDLLLPILVPVLLLNAVLVVVAARAIVRRSQEAAANVPPASPPGLGPDEEPSEEAVPTATAAVLSSEAADEERTGIQPEPDVASDIGVGRTSRSRRRTRRFELPALHEDHERILRSIQAFLSLDEAGTPTRNGITRPGPGTTASTIAVVGIGGYDGLAETAGSRIAAGVAGAVRETLRRAARGTDRIVDLGSGRFCVLLPATGERAAASYLRRVHAACDPWLGATAVPVNLIVATASTGQDVDLEAALRQAERRFERAAANGGAAAG
jgi:hypothetical protein